MDSDGAGSSRTGPEVTGTVVEQLPNALYLVKADEGPAVIAHVTGRVDRNFVRVLVGDRVRVELTPADKGRGRIVEKL